MPSIDSMTELLVAEMRDLYDAEKRLTKAIPRMAKKASNRELKTALTPLSAAKSRRLTVPPEAMSLRNPGARPSV